MKIAVAGVGYVGLSLATLLTQHNEVYAVSTTPAKVGKINAGVSPIKDKEAAYRDAEYVISLPRRQITTRRRIISIHQR